MLNRETQADYVAATYIDRSAGELPNMNNSLFSDGVVQFGTTRVIKLLTDILFAFGGNTRRKIPLLLLHRPSYQISFSFLNMSVIFLITSLYSHFRQCKI